MSICTLEHILYMYFSEKFYILIEEHLDAKVHFLYTAVVLANVLCHLVGTGCMFSTHSTNTKRLESF